MKKIGKRLLAGCLMSVLVFAQIRPEIAYAQEEMTDDCFTGRIRCA